MVALGKTVAMWERTEEIPQAGNPPADTPLERQSQYGLRKDGTLLRKDRTRSLSGEGKDQWAEGEWELIAEGGREADVDEWNRRMSASGYKLMQGEIPESSLASESI